jgi:eukaryotic-like serine/threonine-protein kinase
MDRERRARINAVFDAVVELPPGERTLYLLNHCGHDPELLGEVRALIVAHDRATGILDADPGKALDALLSEPVEARERIGPYRLIQLIGRGGMGVVYQAERADGQYRQRVAIKLLRAEYDAGLHERLLAERQILASLDHPNIARLLDGGITADGRPYLVMEHVQGLPIDVYCERMRLSVEERIALFVQVARAVAYAHRNLIVHRDLKPGNILVTSEGEAKLLDFGVAKLLNPAYAPAAAPETGVDQRLLTPEYASPERLRGEGWGVPADVYSLGVVLYELLTGTRPFDAGSGSLADVVRTVLEIEAVEPSRRVLELAQPSRRVTDASKAGTATTGGGQEAARTTAPRLARTLRGDVDAIVMKALRKEASQRYASAELLAQDLERYLDGQPVQAHAGTRLYLTEKWLRRHRGIAAMVAVVVLALSSGAAASGWQAAVARVERTRSEASRQAAEVLLVEAEAVADFIVALFDASEGGELPNDSLRVRDLLERGVSRADRLDMQPLVQARILESIGRAYTNLGRHGRADTLTQRSLKLRVQELGAGHPHVAATLRRLGIIARNRSDYGRAEQLLQQSLALYQTSGQGSLEEAETLTELMGVAVYRSRLHDAVSYQQRALAIRDSILGPDHKGTLEAQVAYARALRRAGRTEDAVRLLREVMARAQRPSAPRDFDASDPILLLASILDETRGSLEEAESLVRQALAMRRRMYGSYHRELNWPLGALALLRARAGDADEALSLAHEAHALNLRLYGTDHPATMGRVADVAEVLWALGRLAEALPVYEEYVAGLQVVHGREHSAVAQALSRLGALHFELGQFDHAEPLFREALAMRQATLGGESAILHVDLLRLGRLYAARGDHEAAERYMLLALSTVLRYFEPSYYAAQEVFEALAAMYAAAGRTEHAAHFAELALQSQGTSR